MKDENLYQSPQTTNDAVLSDKTQTVKILTRIAAFLEIIGWSMVCFGWLEIINNGPIVPFSFFCLGFALGILGIVIAFIAVLVWFMSKKPTSPLENELKMKIDAYRGAKNSS